MPIYNAETYLTKCIESLIHQTYRALQIILVNDGSTDNSLTIARQYAIQDTRIEVYSQSNQGQAVARNNGILYATGDYLSFVDADDYLDTDFYQTLLVHCDQQDIVHFGFRRVQQIIHWRTRVIQSIIIATLPHGHGSFVVNG